MKEILNKEKNVELIIHLGDGIADTAGFAHDFPFIEVICVRGNGDPGHTPTEKTFSRNGRTFFITHGHLCNVNGGLELLTEKAAGQKADIALYGHTHVSLEKYDSERKLYIMNPGSVISSRNGKPPSYGVVELLPAGIVTTVKKVPTGLFK
jgi:putative phosphoesterase